VLTPELKAGVRRLAEMVRASWTTMQPIGVVRLVGHTDSTGTETLNLKLGADRAEAIKTELVRLIPDLLNRVAIDIDPSPGKSRPIADNRTPAGRAANRRVDVFTEPPIPPAPKWPQPPKPPKFEPKPDDEPWDPYRFKRGIPSAVLRGKSPRDFLMAVCTPIFGKRACGVMVDGALAAGCKGIEILFEKLGGVISEPQKEEIRRQCREGANKPVR